MMIEHHTPSKKKQLKKARPVEKGSFDRPRKTEPYNRSKERFNGY